MNYQLITEKIIKESLDNNQVPTLLIHSCCAPCSSYVLEYLSKYFAITIFYYNPNIYPFEEYTRRLIEQQKLIQEMPFTNPVKLIEGNYSYEKYQQYIKGLESEKEGGSRCFKCYELRMKEAACLAKENNFDYFTTTLSISPYKNAKKINEIGEQLEKEYNVKYLYADFKKKDGYKRSLELSKTYNLYRQNYCGCSYSIRNDD